MPFFRHPNNSSSNLIEIIVTSKDVVEAKFKQLSEAARVRNASMLWTEDFEKFRIIAPGTQESLHPKHTALLRESGELKGKAILVLFMDGQIPCLYKATSASGGRVTAVLFRESSLEVATIGI